MSTTARSTVSALASETTPAGPSDATDSRSSEVVGDGGSLGQTVSGRLRLARPWIILGALLLAVVVVSTLTAGVGERVPLAPDNPEPGGARAIAEVLKNSGVDVVHVSSLAEAESALQDSGDTLVLHDPAGWLDSNQLALLGSGAADRLVLIEPSLPILRELAPEIRSAGLVPTESGESLPAQCSNGDATTAGETTAGGRTYRGEVTCFLPSQGGGESPGGTFATTNSGDVVVLGNGDVLSNALVADHGNAALSLRVLGSTPTLVWYQPTLDDLAPSEEPVDPQSLLPPFVDPLMLWLLITAVLAILWRGRRLGPLVTEPLPVVVRSAETAAGRARLYQDAKAVDHAARTLRAGTLSRLAQALRVPASGSRAEVIGAAVRKTGRDHADLERLLNTYAPHTDAQLVRWSQELEDLEQEIRSV